MSTPIELAQTEELLTELAKRCDAFVFCGLQDGDLVPAVVGSQVLVKGLYVELDEYIALVNAQYERTELE